MFTCESVENYFKAFDCLFSFDRINQNEIDKNPICHNLPILHYSTIPKAPNLDLNDSLLSKSISNPGGVLQLLGLIFENLTIATLFLSMIRSSIRPKRCVYVFVF